MADESLVTEEDAEELIARQVVGYFNLRISKCGGLGRTLAIVARAKAAGIGVLIGCQVGETAVLSAAGRHLAAYITGLCGVEGSYGTHLLVEDIAEPAVMFGPGGSAEWLTGPGLGCNLWRGVTVTSDRLTPFESESSAC